MNNMLVCRDLRCGYQGAQVLHGIDLKVTPGEVLMILGANGAGKTTLLRAISGMLPLAGEVEFEKRRITNMSTQALVRMGVAHVPQGRGTFHQFTTHENLLLGAASLRGSLRDGIPARLDQIFELFPRLADRQHQQASTMSGGEQQMLAIARALMSRPKLLLLDEPSLGLAPQVTAEVFQTLRSLKEDSQISMLVVEQNAHLSMAIADRAAVLESGRIVLEGTPADISNNPALRDAYLGGTLT
ncbi:ABC transporter ATP-binding protein [Pseudonocardia hispaniensis]|uniref:ABC transporter ATP-binding protein n=1 Tax=Pseudonocardia hispaniensis TaxID=904933 RepID=A0ABW1J200_9PSEU